MQAPFTEILVVTATAALGTLALAAAVVRFLMGPTTRAERATLFVAAPLLIVPEFYTDVVGLLLVLIVAGRQVYRIWPHRAGASKPSETVPGSASPQERERT
jgi:TRAP-type uncharacterized transport system fused permease subunit